MKETDMKLVPLNYKILIMGFESDYTKTVSGFAIDTIARICVHEVYGQWQADDYDTGYRINDWFDDKDECIKEAIKKVKKHMRTGFYDEAQKAALKRLAKAGLLK